MESLLSNGWVISGKACKCSCGGDIYKKGEYSLTITKCKTFKLKQNGKLKTHRRLNELDYWIKDI